MKEELITMIIKILVIILGAVWTLYILPWIKSKMNESQYQMLVDFTRKTVKAANQIFAPEEWTQKKDYVVALVTDWVNVNLRIPITDEQINSLIEGIVNEVKKE